jgi:hypothetical protein
MYTVQRTFVHTYIHDGNLCTYNHVFKILHVMMAAVAAMKTVFATLFALTAGAGDDVAGGDASMEEMELSPRQEDLRTVRELWPAGTRLPIPPRSMPRQTPCISASFPSLPQQVSRDALLLLQMTLVEWILWVHSVAPEERYHR